MVIGKLLVSGLVTCAAFGAGVLTKKILDKREEQEWEKYIDDNWNDADDDDDDAKPGCDFEEADEFEPSTSVEAGDAEDSTTVIGGKARMETVVKSILCAACPTPEACASCRFREFKVPTFGEVVEALRENKSVDKVVDILDKRLAYLKDYIAEARAPAAPVDNTETFEELGKAVGAVLEQMRAEGKVETEEYARMENVRRILEKNKG